MADIDHFTDGVGKFFHTERLLDEAIAPFVNGGNCIAHAIAAGQQHLDARFDAFQPIKYLVATDIRHDHVQNHQINLLVGIGKDTDRFLPTTGFDYGIAHFLEHLFTHIQDIGFIVHQ